MRPDSLAASNISCCFKLYEAAAEARCLQAGKSDDAIKSVEEAQQLSKASGTAAVVNQVAVTAAHLQQVDFVSI